MKKWVVKMDASLVYTVEVEAESKEQALELGLKQLEDGEGQESVGSFAWGEWTDVEEKEQKND
jgi:hypothetical protein